MSNFSCPECGVTLRHSSRSCGCGWGKGSGRRALSEFEPINAEQAAVRAQQEAGFTSECRKWLDDHYVTKLEMSKPERMKAMAAYRSMLKTSMRRADVAPKDWAQGLKTDYIDGRPLANIQIVLAPAALGECWENRQCKPLVVVP